MILANISQYVDNIDIDIIDCRKKTAFIYFLNYISMYLVVFVAFYSYL